MKPSRDSDRPSVLALNPRNRETSAVRREQLLAAFDSLDEDARADLLETAETIAARQAPGTDGPRNELRRVVRLAWTAAGWETPSPS